MPAKKKGLAAMTIRADAALQAIYGKKELKPTELMKGLSDYANKHNLKTKGAGKGLAALRVKSDDRLKVIFGNKPEIKWFDLMKGVWAYIDKNKLR
ncbi:MAG: SWIB/MDM2 domain-containing protein [bacterium]